MKLLLDEMFDSAIAEQLRKRGFDVVAVVESDTFRGFSDAQLLDVARFEDRLLVTENVRDFIAIHKRLVLLGENHPGLVLTTPGRFPRTRRGTGKIVRALSRLLEHKEDIWYTASFVHWLR